MPIIRLYLGGAPVPRRKPAPPIFRSTNLGRAYFPGKGVPFSLMVHGLVFLALLVLPLVHKPVQQAEIPPKVTIIDLTDTSTLMYLPLFDGGAQESGAEEEQLEFRSDYLGRHSPNGD